MLKDEHGIVARVGDWALIGGDPSAADPKLLEYFLVWVGEEAPARLLVRAAESLEDPKHAALFKGMVVGFKNEPSPGFVVQVKKQWDFESPARAQAAVETILWEVNHIARGLA